MQLGEFAHVDFVDGKLVLAGDYKHQFGTLTLSLNLELVQVLKLAAAKTDNKIDDSIVEIVAKALEK